MRTPVPSASAARPRPDLPAFLADPHVIEHFDAVLHSVHPAAPPMDATRLAALARWVSSLPPTQARRELQQRLDRLRGLRRMAADADWDVEPWRHAALMRLLSYCEPAHDGSDAAHAHQDREPRLGRLDEALMFELAWPAFAEELEDYRDFRRFRREQYPGSAEPLTRTAWCRLREAHGPLWQQLQRVKRTHAPEAGPVPGVRPS